MNFKWILEWILGELSSPSFQWFFWIVIFLNFPIWGDCGILLQQMGQFHGWFWRFGKTKKIRAKMRVRKIHPEFIQNSLQNSFRNSPKIHPRIYSGIHDDNLKIHLEFTARDSSRDQAGWLLRQPPTELAGRPPSLEPADTCPTFGNSHISEEMREELNVGVGVMLKAG